jgi:ABC-type glycerol-3-phosphate transport system substrate-binding protein
MHNRIGAVFVGLVLVLVGCSSSSKSSSSSSASSSSAASTTAAPSSGGGTNSDFCNRLISAVSQLGTVASAAANPSTAKAQIDKVTTFLTALEPGAPADVSAALSDLAQILKLAGDAIANPTGANASALQDLGTKLPADSQKLSAYITSSCSGAHITTP